MNWKELKEPEESEYSFTCSECGKYYETKPNWVLFPTGWKLFCDKCFEDKGWECDYDKDGAPIEEIYGEKQYEI